MPVWAMILGGCSATCMGPCQPLATAVGMGEAEVGSASAEASCEALVASHAADLHTTDAGLGDVWTEWHTGCFWMQGAEVRVSLKGRRRATTNPPLVCQAPGQGQEQSSPRHIAAQRPHRT